MKARSGPLLLTYFSLINYTLPLILTEIKLLLLSVYEKERLVLLGFLKVSPLVKSKMRLAKVAKEEFSVYEKGF